MEHRAEIFRDRILSSPAANDLHSALHVLDAEVCDADTVYRVKI